MWDRGDGFTSDFVCCDVKQRAQLAKCFSHPDENYDQFGEEAILAMVDDCDGKVPFTGICTFLASFLHKILH